jgi:hypothetical protein
MDGKCLCGAIRYSFDPVPGLVFVCHCTDCQAWTGSAFGSFAVVKANEFRLEGKPKAYAGKGDSGRAITRYFCGTCGSSMYSELAKAPGFVVISVGTLEGGGELTPRRHSWVKRKHSWVMLNEDAQTYQEEMP